MYKPFLGKTTSYNCHDSGPVYALSEQQREIDGANQPHWLEDVKFLHGHLKTIFVWKL